MTLQAPLQRLRPHSARQPWLAAAALEPPRPVTIRIVTGTGEGRTPRAAFEAALLNAGVAHRRLVCLPALIPAGSGIQRARYGLADGIEGQRLYVAVARQTIEGAGQIACAGLGWPQAQMDEGGLFIKIRGPQHRSGPAGPAALERALASLPQRYGAFETEIVGIECWGQPVCALALAVYQA